MLRGFSAAIISALAALAAVGCGKSPLVGGTGGNPGVGGEPCTPETCLPASGGVSGTAGAGLTGSGGTPGAGGSSAFCNQLAADYALATTAALACTPGAPNQCQTLVEIQPSACPDCGQMFVNDATKVKAVQDEWVADCGPVPTGSCPSYSCAYPPAPVTCLPTSPGATTGTCVKYGSDAGAELAPDGGESCDQLAAAYQAAVTAAQACTPGVAGQCQTNVYPLPKGPQGCPFPTAITDATQVNAIRQQWTNQCDPSTAILLIKCDDPGPAFCAPNYDGGVVSTKAGTCQVLSGAE